MKWEFIHSGKEIMTVTRFENKEREQSYGKNGYQKRPIEQRLPNYDMDHERLSNGKCSFLMKITEISSQHRVTYRTESHDINL